MGPKGAEMLRLIPKTRVAIIERCSGHGGIWGARRENFEVAVKVGTPAAEAALKLNTHHVASECPLAAAHLIQVMERVEANTASDPSGSAPRRALHPIEIFARAYGPPAYGPPAYGPQEEVTREPSEPAAQD
jgi:glycerol-3-phosphate dehydrogenase subunit C